MHDVEVDLGGCDVLVAEQLLDGANVAAALQQMRGKAVTQSTLLAVGHERLAQSNQHPFDPLHLRLDVMMCVLGEVL